MTERAFPLLFARCLATAADFYAQLGFIEYIRHPTTGEPTYLGLRRGQAEIGLVPSSWPEQQYGRINRNGAFGGGFEMFVFVDDVDRAVSRLRGTGTPVLTEPADAPWGERIAHVIDPDDNPVALVSRSAPGPGESIR
jgi:lactoylglutathione lyase